VWRIFGTFWRVLARFGAGSLFWGHAVVLLVRVARVDGLLALPRCPAAPWGGRATPLLRVLGRSVQGRWVERRVVWRFLVRCGTRICLGSCRRTADLCRSCGRSTAPAPVSCCSVRGRAAHLSWSTERSVWGGGSRDASCGVLCWRVSARSAAGSRSRPWCRQCRLRYTMNGS
jgi:hypothetical protein